MIADRSKLVNADVAINTRWNMMMESLRTAPSWPLYAMEIPSTGRVEEYEWVSALPQMKEWLSDAQFTHLRGYKYTLVNKFWQAGLEVKREDIEDDRLGLLGPAIQMLANNAVRHPDILVFDLLINGFTGAKGLAYDGQFFFDVDHKDGAGPVQSNKATAALTAVSFGAGWTAMTTLKDELGEPLGIMPTVLVVPPQLRETAKTILELEYAASGASNINYKAMELRIEPRLAGNPTKWFLIDESKPLKPFVFQTREALQFASQDSMTDEHAFMRRVFRYSAFARYNAGYAMWQFAYGSDGTT